MITELTERSQRELTGSMLCRALVVSGLLVLATEAAALRQPIDTQCPGLPGYYMNCGEYGGRSLLLKQRTRKRCMLFVQL